MSEEENFTSNVSWVPKELLWEDVVEIGFFCLIILITVVGNTLVILAVVTTRRLRTVTNCYVMSLAVADWLVGIFVMPLAVALHIMGSWELGPILCDIWISMDVLCCTASILSLCAISVDRYLAVTQPLNYSRRRRSKKLALLMILVVWLAAIAITCPPILGWYDKNHHANKTCGYNKNLGYVIFSAMGSFFIPLIVMLYVYARISCVVATRHDKLGVGTLEGSNKSKTGDESECLDPVDEGHPSIVKCSSMPGEAVRGHYSTTLHPQRLLRVPSQRNSFIQNNSTEMCTYPTRFSFSNRSTRSNHFVPTEAKYESTSRVSSFRRESKTTQTLTIVVGGFVACWLPFFILYSIAPFTKIPALLMYIITWLGWINSAINPFIYAFYSGDFRTAFWRLTFRRCSSNSKKSQQFITRHK